MTGANESPQSYESLLAQTGWLARLAEQLVPAAEREDLVQDVLLSAMRREQHPTHWRGWLATVARHLAARRRRRDHNRKARELDVARERQDEPGPADEIDAFATHRAVVNAVSELDEPYRTAVLLRFWEDLPPREVARRTGVPVETARTRVKRGVDRLRAKLDREAGGRRAWATSLLQIGAVREAVLAGAAVTTPPAAVTITTGVLAMKKTMLAVVAVGAVLATVGVLANGQPVHPAGGETPGVTPSIAATHPPSLQQGRTSTPAAEDRVGVPTDGRPGAVVVRARYHDGAPAADLTVYLRVRTADRLGTERRTGVDGAAEFAELVPGDYRVLVGRGGEQTVRVAAGQTSACEIEIARGVTVRGRVVTLAKQPVAGAVVFALHDEHHNLMVRVAETDAEGAFTLRDAVPKLELYARADGWQPTDRRDLGRVNGRPGETIDVEIELGARGHRLEGVIFDPAGRPAPLAEVGIAVDEDCRKQLEGLDDLRERDGDGMLDRDVFLLRADASGHFATTEVPWGDAVVLARGSGAHGHLVGCAVTRVHRGAVTTVAVHLRPGGAVSGEVRDETGTPYAGLSLHAEFGGSVEVGDLDRGFGHQLTDRTCVTGQDGTYRLEGLFAAVHRMGRVVQRDKHRLGEVAVAAGQEVRLDLTVPRTWQLRVQVQDENGIPLPGWAVMLGSGTIAYRLIDEIRTGPDGVHVAKGLRDDSYTLSVHAPDPEGNRPVRRFPSLVRTVHRGESGVVATVAPATGAIHGRLLDPTGAAVRQCLVRYEMAGFDETGSAFTDEDGSFWIERVPAGEFRLELHDRHFPELTVDVVLEPGEVRELGDLVLAPAAVLEVELAAADGGGIERPHLWLSPRSEPDAGPSTAQTRSEGHRLSGTDGRWQSSAVASGDYWLHVIGRDVAPVVHPVRLAAGPPQRIAVTCERGVVQRFDVELADPVHGERGEGYGWLELWDAQGRYLMDHPFQGPLTDPSRMVVSTALRLVPGTYHVRGRSRLGVSDEWVDVPPGGGPPMRVVLLRR